jgi:hypothetical protein
MDQGSGFQGMHIPSRVSGSCSEQMSCSESCMPNYIAQPQNGFRNLCASNQGHVPIQGQSSLLPSLTAEYSTVSSCGRPKFPSNSGPGEDAYSTMANSSWSSAQPAPMPDQWTLNHGMQKFQQGQYVNFNSNCGANESFYGSIQSSLPVQSIQNAFPQGYLSPPSSMPASTRHRLISVLSDSIDVSRTHDAHMPAAIALPHPDALQHSAFQHSDAGAGMGVCYPDGSRASSLEEEAEAVESWDYSRMSRRGSMPPLLTTTSTPLHAFLLTFLHVSLSSPPLLLSSSLDLSSTPLLHSPVRSCPPVRRSPSLHAITTLQHLPLPFRTPARLIPLPKSHIRAPSAPSPLLSCSTIITIP